MSLVKVFWKTVKSKDGHVKPEVIAVWVYKVTNRDQAQGEENQPSWVSESYEKHSPGLRQLVQCIKYLPACVKTRVLIPKIHIKVRWVW